jgi:hypothetical protein
MSSTNTSSNLWGNTNNLEISNSGARLIMSHPISGFSGGIMTHALFGETAGDGVTAGDVVRYDTVPDSVSYNQYTKAVASSSEYAEVVGVIETIENDVVNVVLSGQIKFPTARFATADFQPSGVGGASGGNDVYFLSGVTAGGISNLAPNVAGQIAKPVLQVANDGVFNAHVVNYIGYQIGGNVAGSTEKAAVEGAINEVVDFDGKLTINENNWHDLSKETWLPYDSSHSTYTDRTYQGFCENYLAGGIYGAEYEGIVSSTPSSTMTGQSITQRDTKGRTEWKGLVVGVDTPSNTITFRSTEKSSNGSIKEPDVTKNFYHNNSQYTPTTITKTAVKMPLIVSNDTVSFTDMYGVSTTKNKKYVMHIAGDDRQAAMVIADDITVQKITALGLLNVTDADGNNIADLAKQVKLLSDDNDTAMAALGKTKTAPTV